jgi:hypothetical protein
MRRLMIALSFCAAGAGSATAQAVDGATPLEPVYACAAIAAPEARLACFDREVAALKAGEQGGQFTAIDAGRVAEIQRESFGFAIPSLPKIALPRLGGDAKDAAGPDQVSAVLAGVRKTPDGKLSFTLENGQVWRQIDAAKNNRAKKGAAVTVRKAALGSYQMSFGSGAALRVRREE